MARSLGEQLGRSLRTAEGKADSRRRLMGAVHAAAKRQGLDEDDRRALQLEVTGKGSLTELTLPEIGRVLDRLNANRPAPSGDRRHLPKVKALWWSLYWLGAVDRPDEAALTAFVKRQTGIERLSFLGHRQAPAVIEALKSWLAREDVRWPDAGRVTEAAGWSPSIAPATLERWAVLAAIERKLRELGQLGPLTAWFDYLAPALKATTNHHHWTDRELDEGIRILGKKLRRELERNRSSD